MAQKFYVVWSGRETGVFTDWATTQRAVQNYSGARFKSFATRAEAEQAFARGGIASAPAKAADGEHPRSRRRVPHITHTFDVSIYCDGACDPNPGHAGSGIALYRAGQLAELWFGLYNPRGTNNTAELNALYHALRMAEVELESGNSVEVCSDSIYSINCIRSWARNWEKRGWTKLDGPIKNLEIIQNCYAIYRRIDDRLSLTHVRGHAGTEGNELADRMAMLAAERRQSELRLFPEPIDTSTLLNLRSAPRRRS